MRTGWRRGLVGRLWSRETSVSSCQQYRIAHSRNGRFTRFVNEALPVSFRNLDSIAISVVLSDAYQKSDDARHGERVTTRGPPDPTHQLPAIDRHRRTCKAWRTW